MQGKRTLVGQDLIEVIDLYRWGASTADLCMLYGVRKETIRENLRLNKIKIRAANRPRLAATKSSLRRIHGGVLPPDDGPTPDQLLRSSAHAQRDKRIVERLTDGSMRFYLEEASECRFAFLRNGSRLPDLE